MPQHVQFWVGGQPAPQGSKTAALVGGRVVMRDANAHRLKAWRSAVAGQAAIAWDGEPMAAAVHVSLTFVFPRPASARRRVWPSVKPDLDKLTRAVLDALTGPLIVDDAQVVSLRAVKEYRAAGSGVVVVVRAMTEQTELAHLEDR